MWNPSAIAQNQGTLPIAEPPCKDCKSWQPRVKTDDKGEYAGVVCCTAETMQRDFLCYESKEG